MNEQPEVKFIISTKAQNNFGRLLDDVSENHTRYVIKRFGHPKAVVISLDDFERLLENEADGERYLQVIRESRPGYVLGETIETSR
jgi:prevent-host-death family protein